MISYQDIRQNPDVQCYVKHADRALLALGYTEHNAAHLTRVAELSGEILLATGADEHTAELARIAGYLHDIGNLVNRVDHSQSGAVMAFRLLDRMGMEADDICRITAAIGNHDEGTGVPIDELSAALILADKSDVRRSRVRNENVDDFDILDRVNYSVTAAALSGHTDRGESELALIASERPVLSVGNP